MTVLSRLLFLLLLVVSPIVVFVTSMPLPARVATHFGPGGRANGWMTHDGYLAFMLLFITLFPLVVAGTTGVLPGMARAMIRKRAAHLDSARFEATVRWLGGHAALVGCLLCLFFLGLHFLILEANARTPPRLDEGAFIAMMAAFLVLLAIWIVVLTLRVARRR